MKTGLAIVILAALVTGACAPAKPRTSGDGAVNTTEFVTVNPGQPPVGQAQGGQDSGGGDPYAVQFIQIAKFLVSTQSREPFLELTIEIEKLSSTITEIDSSLEGHKPLLSFPIGATTECFGVPKLGCVEDHKIRIAREGWESATLAEKIQVTAMEVLLLAGEKNRYALASKASAALAKTLVLTDGNVVFPTSIDRAREIALKMLNKKDSNIRKKILLDRENKCFEISGTCLATSIAVETNDFEFTETDVLSVTHLGNGEQIDPCKKEECFGEDVETSRFLVAIRSDGRSKWANYPSAVVLDLKFERYIRQDNGKMRSRRELSVFGNSPIETLP